MKKTKSKPSEDAIGKCANLMAGLLAVPHHELDEKQVAYKRKRKREKGKR